MSVVVGNLKVKLGLDRSSLDQEIGKLRSLTMQPINLRMQLDTRQVQQQIRKIQEFQPTIKANIAIANLNQIEQQLKVFTRDRSLGISLRLDAKGLDQQLQDLTRNRYALIQAELVGGARFEQQLATLTQNRTISIGVNLDETGLSALDKRLEDYRDRSFKVTAQVDDSRLTALNKHLDLKVKHFTQVNNYFKSSPLKPRVDDSELKKLEQLKSFALKFTTNLGEVRSQVEELRSRLSAIEVPVTVRYANTQPATQTVTQKVSSDTSDFEKNVGNSIEKAFARVKKGGLLSGLGGILTAPLKLAGGAISGVFTGVTLGIGREISREVGQGLSSGIQGELGEIIGSFRFVGKEVGAGITKEIIDALGADAEKIRGVFEGVLGKDGIVNESAAARQQESKRQSQVRRQASTQVNREFEFVRENLPAIKARGEAAQVARAELTRKQEALQVKINERANALGVGRLQKQVEEINQQREQIFNKIAADDGSNIAVYQRQLDRLSASAESIQGSIKDLNSAAANQFRDLSDRLEEEAEKVYREEQVIRRITAPIDNIDLVEAPKNLKTKQGKTEVNKERVGGFYRQTFDEVAKLSGVNPNSISRDRIPKLVANPKLPAGANAAYAADLNQVQVSSDLLKAINSGTVTKKQLETLVHELRHAFQANLGQNLDEKSSVELLRPTVEEAKQFGRKVESSVAGSKGYSSEYARKIESDAYTFASRNTDSVYGKLGKSQAISQLENSVGVGGGKLQLKLEKAQKLAFGEILKLSQSATVDVSQEMQSAIAASEKAAGKINGLLNQLGDLDILPVEQIKALQAELETATDQAVQEILQQYSIFESEIATKPEQVRSQISASLGQFNRKKELVPLAQEFGIENADKLKKSELISQLASRADLRQLQPRVNEMTRTKAQQQFERQEKIAAAAQVAGQVARGTSEVGKSVFSRVKAATESEVAQQILGAGANTVRGLGAAAKATYKLAAAAESLALDMVPMGRTAKGLLKQTAVPALAFGAATHLLPGGGMVAEGLQSLAQGAISPVLHGGGSAIAGQASGFISQALPNVAGIQAHVAGAVTGMIDGAVNAAIAPAAQALTAVVGGKIITGAAGNAIAPTTEKSTTPALPAASAKALPAATQQRELQDLTKAQLQAIAQQHGLSKQGNKPDLIARLEKGLGYSKLDPILANIDNLIDRKGVPTGGYNAAAEKAMLAEFKQREKAIDQKIRDLKTATGQKREQLLESLYAESNNLVDSLEQTKKQLLSGKTAQALGQMQGRVEGTFRHSPEINEARTGRIKTANQSAANAGIQTIDVPSQSVKGLARVAESEVVTLGQKLKEGLRKLTNFTAKQFEVVPQPTIKGTLGAIAKSPKAIDLAVNTAGFAASQVGAKYGVVPELAGDLMGALTARQVLSRGRPSAKDLTGDIAGFGIGNGAARLANAGLDALSGVVPGAGVLRAIPFKGAIAASIGVPKVAKIAEQFQQPEGLARTESKGLLSGVGAKLRSLLPNQQKNLDQVRANYEAIYREIAAVSGVAFDPKNLPKLSIDPARLKKLGADAFYDLEENTIVIDKTIAKILGKRTEALHKYAEQLKGLTHESRHAIQTEGGKLGLEEAASRVSANPEQLTTKQRSQVEKSVDVARRQGISGQKLEAVRKLEADAYGFEGKTGQILSRASRRAVDPRRLRELELEAGTSRITSADELGSLTGEQAKVVAKAANSSDRFDQKAARIQANQDKTFARQADPLQGGATATDRLKFKLFQEGKEYVEAFNKSLKMVGINIPAIGQGLSGLFGGGGGFKGGIEGINAALKGLVGNAGLIVKGFLGFAVLSNVLPQIKQFATESIKASIELQKLKTALNFATGSPGKAAEGLAFVRSEADRLGAPLASLQTGFVKLSASTKGTAIAGQVTKDLVSGLGSASTTLGLSADETSGAILALSQMASKGKVQAEELRGQLGERIPGAFSIAARSMGVTEAQLNKLLETGAVTANDFLPKFARQLQVEFAGSAESASQSTAASLNRLQGAFQKTQESAGGLFEPAVGAGAAGLAQVLEFLAKNGAFVAQAFLGLGAVIAGPLLGPLAKLLLSSGVVKTLLGVLGSGVMALKAQLGSLALQFAIITVGMEAVRAISEAFSLGEVGQQFKELGDQGEKNFERVAEAARKAAGIIDEVGKKPKELPSKGFGFDASGLLGMQEGSVSLKTDDLIKLGQRTGIVGAINNGNAAFNRTLGIDEDFGRIQTVAEKQQQDRTINFNRLLSQGNDLASQSFSGRIAIRDKDGNAIKDAQGKDRYTDIASSLSEAQGLDKQIQAKQNERDRMANVPRADKIAIAKADEEIQKLSQQRTEKTQAITNFQSALQSQLGTAKTQLTDEKLSDQERNDLKSQIEGLEKAQSHLNKIQNSFGTAADRALEFKVALAEMNIALEQVKRNADIQFNLKATGITRKQIDGFKTDENASLTASTETAKAEEAKAIANRDGYQRVFDERKAKVSTPEAKAVLDSILIPGTGKSISMDSSIEELKRAKDGQGLDDGKKKQIDDLIAYKESLQQKGELDKSANDATIARIKAVENEKLELIQRSLAKEESLRKRSLAREQVTFIQKQAKGSNYESDNAVENAKLQAKQTSGDFDAVQKQLSEIEAAYQRGEITKETYTQKQIELENRLSDLSVQKAQNELAIVKATEAAKLAEIERTAQKRELLIKRQEAGARIGLVRQKLTKSISDDDANIAQAKIQRDGTISRQGNVAAQLAELEKAYKNGTVKKEEFEKRSRDLTSQTLDLSVQAAENELAIREAINQKILNGMERRLREARANLEIDLGTKSSLVKSTGVENGFAGAKASALSATLEIDGGKKRLAILQEEEAEIRKLRSQGVISEKDMAERILNIRSTRQQESAKVADLELQIELKRIQAVSEAEQRSLDNRKTLLDADLKLVQAVNSARQSGLKIGVDRGSETVEGFKQLRSIGEGEKEAPQSEKVLKRQLRDAGYSTADLNMGLVRSLQDKQAMEAQLDSEKLNSLQQQQQLERESLKIQLELEQVAARRALNEARIAELKAKQNLADAMKSGDAGTIKTAQDILGLSKEAVDIASGQLGILDQKAAKELEIQKIQQGQGYNEAVAEAGRNSRQRDRDLATQADEVGYTGNLRFSGNAAAGYQYQSMPETYVPKLEPNTARVDQAVNSAANSNADIIQKLEQMYNGIVQLARTPNSLTVISANPVSDAAKIRADISKQNLQDAGY